MTTWCSDATEFYYISGSRVVRASLYVL